MSFIFDHVTNEVITWLEEAVKFCIIMKDGMTYVKMKYVSHEKCVCGYGYGTVKKHGNCED